MIGSAVRVWAAKWITESEQRKNLQLVHAFVIKSCNAVINMR